MNLHDLREKFGDRALARKRQVRLFKKTGDQGHARAAAKEGRAMRKLAKLIAKVIHSRLSLANVRIKGTAGGRPHWGGGADVMGQFVTPFMRKRGLAPGSKKRTPQHNAEIGGSPTSDHLTTQTMTFACDFPTFSGEDDARALAAALGNQSWSANSFATFDVVIDGHTFRVQILWGAAIDHSDHVHVGIALVS